MVVAVNLLRSTLESHTDVEVLLKRFQPDVPLGSTLDLKELGAVAQEVACRGQDDTQTHPSLCQYFELRIEYGDKHETQ